MTNQIIDPSHLGQKTRRIKTRVSAVLKKWGLIPRFKRWRLTQDPDTGMVVLFGVLNNTYIAAHTPTPFSNYFDPRLLRDLADELQVEVLSSDSDGLRYAFILDRGQLETLLPTEVDFPFVDNGKLLAKVVYSNKLKSTPPPSIVEVAVMDDHKLVRLGVGAFLKVFDDIKRIDENTSQSVQTRPDVVVIDQEALKKKIVEHEANRKRIKHIRKLFDKTVE